MSNRSIAKNRREFCKHLATLTGTVVIAPMAIDWAETNRTAVGPVARVDVK